MILPSSKGFHCCFNDSYGSDTFRAGIFWASFFLNYTNVDVLSPNVTPQFIGLILTAALVAIQRRVFPSRLFRDIDVWTVGPHCTAYAVLVLTIM